MALTNQPVAWLEVPGGGRVFSGDNLPTLSTDGIYQAGDYYWLTTPITNSCALVSNVLYRCVVGTVVGSTGPTWVIAGPSLQVPLTFGGVGSTTFYSAQVAFVAAEGTYQLNGVTATPAIYGSNSFGCQLFKVSGGQNEPSVAGGLQLLTNSLSFVSAGTQYGSIVQSVPALQFAPGDWIGIAFNNPANLQGLGGQAAAVGMNITLKKLN